MIASRTLLLVALCALAGDAAAFLQTPAAIGGRLLAGRSGKHFAPSRRGGLRGVKLTASTSGSATIVKDAEVNVSRIADILTISDVKKRVGNRRTVIITGSSSGIGLAAATELACKRGWHVIMAVRSYSKAKLAAQKAGIPEDSYTVMSVDLASLQSVRDFAASFKATGLVPDALVCNAAVWYPLDIEPRLSADGYEENVATNHLAHFLLCQLMLPIIPKGGRVLFIGTETANDGIAGKVPPVADLGNLEGMKQGMSYTIDGGEYEPTKSYKESKVCNAIVMREMNKRYAESRGITVNAMFPGCIAESPLFRQKRGWFRWLFPLFQKYVTKQFVEEKEAGRRIADTIDLDELAVGGAYWKWNAKSGIDAEFVISDENSTPAANVVRIPGEALDEVTAEQVWDLSAGLTGVQVAPEVDFDYDGLPQEESKRMRLQVSGKYIRDDVIKAEIFLKKLRALGDDITNEEVMTRELAREWSEEMEGETKKMGEALYYWGRRAQAPMISIKGEAGDNENSLSLEITSQWPRYDEAAAEVFTEGLKSVLPTEGPTEVPELVPTSFTAELAEKMDVINMPPSGLDAAVFGERGSLKRLVAETLSRGVIKA
uniref:protochlorophyllide reductase n=1 Tax=Hemiselmis andersenii TaxID=464988 RepID=A0A6T8NUL2_HEMAN|mmetsp:Transcript_26575/g.64584  ORF Transcript_26575/g.64584 Transcript_26575/m.64584 type:complete len:602 (+) Transcript_26575:58-1863(+)